MSFTGENSLKTFLVILFIYLFLQFLFSGYILQRLINLFFYRYIIFSWKSPGLILPLFIVYAKNFHLEFVGYNNSDHVVIRGKKIVCFIHPLYLLIGIIKIYHLRLDTFQLHYINQIDSLLKVKYLPRPGAVRIYDAEIINSKVYVEDHTMMPVYKLTMENINAEEIYLDAGAPLGMIFNMKQGDCKIGSGNLSIRMIDQNNGNLTLTGITWGELAGLKVIPLPLLKKRLDLQAEFHYINDEHMHINGDVGNIPEEILDSKEGSDKGRFRFRFEVNWKDYTLPFDLALRKLVSELLIGLHIRGVIGITLRGVTKGFINMFKINQYDSIQDKKK